MDWSDTSIAFFVRPHCPSCGSTKATIIRSADQGDGSTLRKCLCRSCGAAYRVVLEPPVSSLPETGKRESATL